MAIVEFRHARHCTTGQPYGNCDRECGWKIEQFVDEIKAIPAEPEQADEVAGLDVERLRDKLMTERAAATDNTALMNPERDYWIGVKDGYCRAIEAMDAALHHAEPERSSLRRVRDSEQADTRIAPRWLSDAVHDVATTKVIPPIPGQRAAELFADALWPAIEAHIPAEPVQADEPKPLLRGHESCRECLIDRIGE